MQDPSQKRDRVMLQGISLRARNVLIAVAMYLAFLIVAFAVISPEQYDLAAGDVAPATITASRDIVDENATERRKTAAVAAVSSVYYRDESVSEVVLQDLETAFSGLRSVRELGAQIRSGDSYSGAYTDSDYQQASALVSDLSLTNFQLRTLMNTTESDFESLYQSLLSATRTALVSTINEGQVEDAIANIQQIVAYNTRTDLWYNIGIPLLRKRLKPNMLIDQEATEANRQKAAEAIEPILYKQGQNIVVKGDRVTSDQIAVLEALGLISGDGPDLLLYLGTALIVASILVTVILVADSSLQVELLGRNSLIMFISAMLTVLVCLLVGNYTDMAYMPVLIAPILVVNLIGARPAYLTNLFMSLYFSFLAFKGTDMLTTDMLRVLLMTSAGGTLAIHLMRKNPTRVYLLLAGLAAGALNFVLLSCVGALTSSEGIRTVLSRSFAAVPGSLLAAVLCIGLQPVMESLFNLITPAKLVELSNPSQPLLRRLMIEAPGTYHHSMVVANLAEAAAEEVGADALLVRVGAYYHDIGKLLRPQYFKENQVGDNPHDRTEPRMSAAILTEHTRDGAELARKQHLPQQIIDLIQQHHGDTPVMYFYAKAIEKYGADNVDVADYRYDGPKPQTEEAAILMLSDTVEAAVRSLQDPTREKMSEMIRKLVRNKMEDGQLDECTLTFRDIGKICNAFETVLQGVFHERIEYPDLTAKKAGRPREKGLRSRAGASK